MGAEAGLGAPSEGLPGLALPLRNAEGTVSELPPRRELHPGVFLGRNRSGETGLGVTSGVRS